MLQRQIVNGLGKQIEDALYIKYTIRCFQYIDWMFIPVHVTIDRTVPIHEYQIVVIAYCWQLN